jgi:hypothetical protein
VFSSCSLASCILARVAAALLEMSDAFLLRSFRSNETFIMLHFLMRMILTTLLIKELLKSNVY